MHDTAHPQRNQKPRNTRKPAPGKRLDPLYAVIARNLRAIRVRAGLKRYAAADRLGVSKSTWSQWESGARFPNGAMLAALAAHLDVRPCTLLRQGKCVCDARPDVHKT